MKEISVLNIADKGVMYVKMEQAEVNVYDFIRIK